VLTWNQLQQNLAPTKCKVPSTKLIALCDFGKLPTVTLVTRPLTLGSAPTQGGIPK
jgi:hypothetical protein